MNSKDAFFYKLINHTEDYFDKSINNQEILKYSISKQPK